MPKKTAKKRTTAASAKAKTDNGITLKKGDYFVDYGTLKLTYKRAIEVGGKPSHLKVILSLNFTKDLFSVDGKLDNDQMTGDPLIDSATRQMLRALIAKAMEDGLEWRKERKEAKLEENESNPLPGNQGKLKLGFTQK